MTKKDQIPLWPFIGKLLCYAPKLYAFDTLFWLLIYGLPAIPGLIIGAFFDRLTGKTPLDWSTQGLILVFLAVGVARLASIFLGRLTKTQHRFLMSGLVRHNLLQQLFQHPGAKPLQSQHHDSETTSIGKIISYFREDAQRIEDNIAGVNETLGDAILATISLIILFRVNVMLTLLVLLPLGVIALVIQKAEKHIKQQHYRSRHITQKVTGFIGEIFGAVQGIQIAGAQESVLHQFQTLNDQRHRQMVKNEVLIAGVDSLLGNLTEVGTGLILLVVAIAQTQNMELLTVGDFALFVYYLSFVSNFFWSAGTFLTTSKQTEVALERITNLLPSNHPYSLAEHHSLHLPPMGSKNPPLPKIYPSPVEAHNDLPRRTSHLEILQGHNLTYHYPHSNNGISGINLTLKRGSFTVVTGAVGTGKTTLLQVILGLLPLQGGEITYNGEPVKNPATFFVPPRSAYTPQVPHLFSYTLKENLLLGWDDTHLQSAIYQAVFEKDLAAMPEGLDTVIGTRGVRLSGGQQQRAAATRMFLRRPELIVCDDLSSALDIHTEQKLWSRLFAQSKNENWTPTCLVVSHRPTVLKQADQVIYL